MGFMRNPQYEMALRASLIEHGLRGDYDPSCAELTSGEVLFSVWRDAVAKLMAPREREQFLTLSVADQKEYLGQESFFEFSAFRADFINRALEVGRLKNPYIVN